MMMSVTQRPALPAAPLRASLPVSASRARPPARSTGWAVYALLASAALAAVFVAGRGWYIADARFELFWSSGRFLTRQRALWDGTRGLGRPSPYYSPVVAGLVTVLRALGASPWIAGRLPHAPYLF